MKLWPLCISCLLLASTPDRSLAAGGMPPQLLNKTINLSFSTSMPARNESGRVIQISSNQQRLLYISSKGRVFSRRSQSSRRGSVLQDKGPAGDNYRFQGGALVGVWLLASGASQIRITFDSGFRSCTFTIVSGKENGRALKVRGLAGGSYEAVGARTVSGQNCSIKDGNVFAE